MSHLPPPAGQPTSFKTNVNRAKTKRWVEAKSYSYDGDDWGEVDDYDEYGGYDELQPPPKPTGLRQRGQSATHPVPAARDGRNEDNGGFGYSNLGGQPVAQHHQGLRSTTNPQPLMNTSLMRSNSFDRGDEKRVFSAGGHPESIGNGPYQAPGFQQGQSQPPLSQQGPKQGYPSQQGPYQQPFPQQDPSHASASQRGLLQTSRLPLTLTDEQHLQSPAQFSPDQRQTQPEIGRVPLHIESQPSGDIERGKAQQTYSQVPNYRGVSYSDQPRQSSFGSRTQSMTSNDSSLDFQNRRDFSPSAIPPPLQTQASPSSHSPSEVQSSARFPPRKSSLSQMSPPNLANPNQVPPLSPPTTSADDLSATKDYAGNNSIGKPLPFVRPADIYKRMQEEKEKERKSQDSSRPSVHTPLEQTTGGVAFLAQSSAVPNSIAGSQGSGLVRTGVNADTSESSQNSRKPLDSVAERKSEYAIDGVGADDERRDIKQTDSSSSGYQKTLRPILPDVTRMSGFGDLLIGTDPSSENQSHAVQDDSLASSPQLTPQAPSQDGTAASLQHQSSAGFRSVVNQAFDTVQDQIPATPSSASGSGIGRSASGGTSVISPIISRGPSVTKRSETAKDTETRALTPPPKTLKDVDSTGGRPLSSSTLGTPKQIVRKPSPSPSPLPGLNEPVPTTFIPGHRRDLSTPSPDNSPARTPVLESNRQLRKPQEVELAIATPIEPVFPSMQGLPDQESSFTGSQFTSSNLVPEQNTQQNSDPSPAVRDRLVNFGAFKSTDVSKGPRDDSATASPVTLHDGATRSRAESPSKNRVRDLAGKFESGSPSRRGSDLSTALPGVSTPRKDSIPQPRPLADRLESFRPQLPGGWESFSSSTPARALSKQDDSGGIDQVEGMISPNPPDQPKETLARADSPVNISHSLDCSPSKSEPTQPSSDPFTAVAAAGSALAGAILASFGGDNNDSPTSPLKEPLHDSSSDHLPSTRSQTASVSTPLYPEASAPLMPRPADNEDSGESTTSLRKDSLQTSDEEEANLTNAAPKLTSQNDTPKDTKSVEESAHLKPQSMLPPLSTNIRDHQYESDRLRREIVKNLSPRGVSEPTTAESESPWQDDTRMSADPSLVARPHDSMNIPIEYDSYWNGSDSGGGGSRINSGQGKLEPTLDTTQQRTESIKAPPPLRLSTGYSNASAGDITKSIELPQAPDLQQHRYSWENASGNVEIHGQNTLGATGTNISSVPYTSNHENRQYMGKAPGSLSQDGGPHTSNVGAPSVRMVVDDSAEGKEQAINSDVSNSSFARDQLEKMPLHQDQDSGPQQNFAPFEETNLPRYTSSLPISEPYLPPMENNSSVDRGDTQANPTAFQNTLQLQPGHWEPAPPMVQSTSDFNNQDNIAMPSPPPPPPPPLLSAQPKIPAFREILALKTPAERIRAFNETREQLAHVGTGLPHWLAVTSSELPEHAAIVSGAERPTQAVVAQKPMPFKAKIPGLRSAGAQAPQQPYYQQYLNATPQATSSEGIGGQNTAGSSSQGFSPSGSSSGKLSTQQVQAKGKDLLQAAGVFGGRANVAAKGFFSKGRSKFRGGSGVDKVANPTPSPDPVSRGMQPQHQPQTERNLPIQISSPTQPLLQEPSNVQSSAGQLYSPFTGLPDSGKEHSSEVLQGQEAQPSHTHEKNQLHNTNSTKSLPEPRNKPSVPEPVRPQRYSDFQGNSTVLNENHFEPAGSNEQVQTATVGDVVPISSHATPTAESLGGFSEAQRRNSNASSNQTPTQAHFNRSGRDGGLSSPVLNDEQVSLRKERGSDPSFKTELASDTEDREDEIREVYKKENSAPQSHNFAQTPSSTDMAHERNMNRQASAHALKQQSSGPSDGMFFIATSHEGSQDVPGTEVQSTTQPQVFSQGRPQALVPRGGSPSQSGLIPPSQPQSASTGTQRAARPFSFMEYSQDQPTQPRPEVLQRAPSIESIPSQQYLDRPPSPVSPQRSVTRDVSEEHERTVPTHYDINHDFFPSDNGSGPLRRPRSFSRPFQGPNLLEHPAFRYEGPQVRGADIPTEYYSAQRPREEIRLPRQQTTEYQLEGVGPPAVPRPETKSRSRHSSRSSIFFRNLGNSTKAEGTSKNSPEAQHAESPTKDAAATRKKSNRNSVFRSLTGRSGSDRDQTPASVEQPVVQPPKSIPQQPVLIPPRNVEKEFAASGTSSKVRSKLQRASTSGAPEKPVGKKKRFSAIGSLFGRPSNDKQNSPAKLIRDRPRFERPINPPTRQSPSFNQQQPQISTEEYPTPIRQEASFPHSTSASQDSRYYAPQEDYVNPPQGGYYAPDRSSQDITNRPTFQAAQKSHPKPREPPAYVQDSSLRQKSASRSQSTTTIPHASQPTTPLPETFSSDLAQPRQSHWLRNPAMHRSNNSYSSANNTDDGSNSYRTQSMQNSQTQLTWLPPSQSTRQSYQRAPQTPNAPTPPVTTYSPPHNPSPNLNNPQGYFAPRSNNLRTGSPSPPPPPPKDQYASNAPSQSSHPPFTTNTASSRSPAPSPNPRHQYPDTQSSSTPSSTWQQQHQSPPPIQTTPTTGSTGKSLRDKAARKSRQMEIERGSVGLPASSAVVGTLDGGAGAGAGTGSTHGDQRWRGSNSGRSGPARGSGSTSTSREDGDRPTTDDVQDDEDHIVMSSTSYPGQEWSPRWDGD